MNENYLIECVCGSAGKKLEKTGLAQLCLKNNINKAVDYKAKKDILCCRMTSSIRKKLDFYIDHIKNNTIPHNSPYIIFLGLGALSSEWFSSNNGIEFTSILFGKGDTLLSIDENSEVMSNIGYSHNKALFNHNNAKIDCNIFRAKEYCCISGIIISDADLGEEYTLDNTWLFLNPYAHTKVDPSAFPHMVYWDLYNKYEYGPYKDGQKIANP